MLEDPVPMLKEDGRKTMWAAFESIRYLVNGCCSFLHERWQQRKATPDMLRQPHEQWREIVAPVNAFDGYESTKLSIKVEALMTDPSAPRRLEAAALTVEKRSLWSRG